MATSIVADPSDISARNTEPLCLTDHGRVLLRLTQGQCSWLSSPCIDLVASIPMLMQVQLKRDPSRDDIPLSLRASGVSTITVALWESVERVEIVLGEGRCKVTLSPSQVPAILLDCAIECLSPFVLESAFDGESVTIPSVILQRQEFPTSSLLYPFLAGHVLTLVERTRLDGQQEVVT